MRILLDTNVLCRLAQRQHPDHATAYEAVSRLHAIRHELCLVPQVLYEYWVVATRTVSENGLGMSTADAHREIDRCIDLFTLLRDERGIFSNWHSLVDQYEVKGKKAHDARLVAAMLRHGLVHLVTFNASDFARFPAIEVRTPQAICATSVAELEQEGAADA